MRPEEFNYPSADKQTEIHGYRWVPEGPVRAVLQIVHGMVEHAARYHDFAEYLAEEGILVTAQDHLGHGKSVTDEKELGHFPRGGNVMLLKDIHALRLMTRRKAPEVPYFMLGHSMGSYLLREYLCLEGEGLAGALLLGTGDEKKSKLLFGEAFSRLKMSIQGDKHHSRLLTLMAFGRYNKRISPAPLKVEWLTRDLQTQRAYKEDPLCGGTFTNAAFHEFFLCMLYLKKKAHLLRMPKDLPVLLAAGDEDPVGAYGKGVRQVERTYRQLGLLDVTCKLYPGARHEILNETNQREVYADLYAWIKARCVS